MRKRLDQQTKRNNIIGVKVQPETRDQIKYIASREATTSSTLINEILKDYIFNYFKIAKIEWKNLSEDEKRGDK